MTAIRIAPVPQRFLDKVRNHDIDDLGQPVKRVIAEGGEPCRDVLRRARAGEELILASFSPFAKTGPYREFGPVFVLANPSDEPVNHVLLPIEGDPPYLREQFVIRAYSHGEEIRDAKLTSPGNSAETIARFFDNDETAFLHVRFPTYGCFALRIDRA